MEDINSSSNSLSLCWKQVLYSMMYFHMLDVLER
jgi:hypothetical protein